MAFTGLLLGFAGLAPFIATTLGLWWTGDDDLLRYGLLYGAVILSFLGGIQWGAAIAGAPGTGAGRLVVSVLPSFVAWGALVAPPLVGPLMLALGIVGAWIYEQRRVVAEGFPDWYRALRHLLTLVVTACLVADAAWVWLRW